jgi:hypothetical protein
MRQTAIKPRGDAYSWRASTCRHRRAFSTHHCWRLVSTVIIFFCGWFLLSFLFFNRLIFWKCRHCSGLHFSRENGRFPVPASCVENIKPQFASSSKTGVNPGIRGRKNTYLIEPDVRKPLVESISHRSEELRLNSLV